MLNVNLSLKKQNLLVDDCYGSCIISSYRNNNRLFFKLQNDEYPLKRIQRKEKTVNLSLAYFLSNLQPEEVNDFISRDFDLKVHEIAEVNSFKYLHL